MDETRTSTVAVGDGRPDRRRGDRLPFRPKLFVLLLPLATALTVPAAAAAAPARLTGAARVLPGARVTVAAAPAGARFWLSRDARRDRADVALGAGRKASGHRRTLTVPRSVLPGTYRLLACRGKRCTAVRGTLRVGRPPVTGGGTPATSGGGAPSGGSTPPVTSKLPPFDAPAHPRSISRTLDSGHSATGTIGASGGQLAASAADGTQFTLTVPAGALVGDQAITLTPVAAVGGLPFSSLGAAVELGPDGLSLLKAATLRIDDPMPVPPAQRVGFGWHGTGQELHLESIGTDPGTDLIRLWHFSGYGTAAATADQRAAQQQAVPTATGDRLQQQLGELDQQVKAGGATASAAAAYTATLLDVYATRVRPAMDAARTDDRLATSAIRDGLMVARTIELLDLQTDPRLQAIVAEIMAAIPPIARNAMEKAYERCMGGEPAYVPKILALERALQLMGVDDAGGTEKVRNCARFDLDVDGTYTEDLLGVPATARWQVTALPIRMDSSGTRFSGQGALSNAGWTVGSAPDLCLQTTGTSPGSPFTVLSLDIAFSLFTEMGADGREYDVVFPPEVAMTVSPGLPAEHSQWDPKCDGGWQGGENHVYANGFFEAHPEAEDTGAALLANWTPGTDGVYATYVSNGAAHEHLVLKLHHVPAAAGLKGR